MQRDRKASKLKRFPENVCFRPRRMNSCCKRQRHTHSPGCGLLFHHGTFTLSGCHGSRPQVLPPAAEPPHTVDFLSSIFMDWPSARDSNLVTVDTPTNALLVGFTPFDTGMRVAALRADCTSGPGWKGHSKFT